MLYKQDMDQITYNYNDPLMNRLSSVEDPLGVVATTDIGGTHEYGYDDIGNLTSDIGEEIETIEWTVSGKVKKVIRFDGSAKANLEFFYDAMGNRVMKKEIPDITVPADYKITWYSRDASGIVMATYSSPVALLSQSDLKLSEVNLYGSSRLGMLTVNELITALPELSAYPKNMQKGKKFYELSNHLGNVLSVVSDRLFSTETFTNSGIVDYYVADLVSSSDYYPFGMGMYGRGKPGPADGYRFGFNGMEKDDELKGSGNSYDFGARIYDSRLMRWLSLDPLQRKYAHLSPYHFTGNNPIAFVDKDGKDFTYSIIEGKDGKKTILIKMTIFAVSNEAYNQAVHGAAIWNDTKFISKGYTVKFDIQVIEPPIISEDDVIEKAKQNGDKVFSKKGREKKRKYRAYEEEIQNERMMRDAQNAYDNGKVGENNIYAGSNNFVGIVIQNDKPAKTKGFIINGESNGKAIVTHRVTENVPLPATPGMTSTGSNTQKKLIDQGNKPYIVGHEIGHNLGFPDYTDLGIKSGGIMDYLTDQNGQISQYEIDALVNQILKYDAAINTTLEGTSNSTASGRFKRPPDKDGKTNYSKAVFKHSNQP